MSSTGPQYNVTRNANTDGAAVTSCSWCGAAVADTELHTLWHRWLVKDLATAMTRSTAASRAS